MTGRLWLTGAMLLLAACGSGGQGPVAGEDYADLPADQIIFGVKHYVTANGVRQAILVADTAYYYEDPARVELRKVHLTLFQSTGQEAADLTSESGDLEVRTNAMVARGNVVLVTREGGRRVETEELHYDPHADRIWSDVPTTLYEHGSVLRGDGFESDAQLRNSNLRNPRGQVQGGTIKF